MIMKNLIVGALACVTLLVSSRAHGQDIFGDVFREAVDEVRLRQDYRSLQRDLATGNSVGAQYDLMRIQQDSSNLARDQMQLNYDLNRGASMLPYQNYGTGYYYPSGAAQMYYSPNQQFITPNQQFVPLNQQLSQPVGVPLNPVPTTAGIVPANPVPGIPQTVRISNPDSTGLTLSFVFGGKTYSVDSGRTEEFTVTAPTLIVFSRGGQAGVARYTLAGGNAFEFKFDSTGWFMVQKRQDQASPALNGVPTNPVPPSPTALPAALPGPGPVTP
jgi:hypothetical protein